MTRETLCKYQFINQVSASLVCPLLFDRSPEYGSEEGPCLAIEVICENFFCVRDVKSRLLW